MKLVLCIDKNFTEMWSLSITFLCVRHGCMDAWMMKSMLMF